MRAMTARKMWNAHRKNKLPPEWKTWAEFRAWVNANQYKAAYEYQGEFTPENLLKAIPGAVSTSSFDSLMRMRLDELKQFAVEKGFEVSDTATKREIATLICGGEQVG